MKRCSLREWIPILPIPVWPLAWQCLLGQNTGVGSMRCSFWLCVEACQEEYVGIPIFTTSALHHGSGQRYRGAQGDREGRETGDRQGWRLWGGSGRPRETP